MTKHLCNVWRERTSAESVAVMGCDARALCGAPSGGSTYHLADLATCSSCLVLSIELDLFGRNNIGDTFKGDPRARLEELRAAEVEQ